MTLPAGYARITLNFTGTGVPNGASIVYACENTGDAPATELGTEAVTAWTSANMKGLTTNDLTLSSVLVKKGPDATGASAEVTAAVTSSVVNDTAGPAVALLIHKHTALGGRRGRGRMYIPCPSVTDFDDGGNIAGATVTADNTVLANWLAAYVAAGTPLVLEHSPPTEWVLVTPPGSDRPQPRRVAIEGAEVPNPTVITGLTVASKVATQRRRLRG